MTTIEQSAQLRRVILASLGAAALFAASLANAATTPAKTNTLAPPFAALVPRLTPDARPLGAAPLAEPLISALTASDPAAAVRRRPCAKRHSTTKSRPSTPQFAHAHKNAWG